MGQLVGRRAVITGAAAGIGRATAQRLADEGARVLLVDVDPAVEEAAAAIAPAGCAAGVVADVSLPGAVERVAELAVERLGGVDTLVNNAAIHRVGPVDELSLEDWEATFAVNVRSCFLTTRALVPELRRAGGGAIVNTTSQVALRGAPGATAYAASKGAVISFTRSLARELAPDGIRVNAICPGWVATPFNDPVVTLLGGSQAHASLVRESVPLGRQAEPHEIAAGTLFLVSAAASYMTGQVLTIDGGAT
jgi:dihydroanticapsin dehydrogenase